MPNWLHLNVAFNELKDEPWKMYWAEWKSQSDEFKSFLFNPLSTLVDYPELKISDRFSISTEILNHAIPLTVSIVCTIIIVMPTEKHLKILIYKHRPDGE